SSARTVVRQPPAGHSGGKVHFDLLAKLLADVRRSPAGDWTQELAEAAPFRAQTQPHPLLGRAAPGLTLPDSQGQGPSLQQPLGRGPVVLLFYLGYACDACVHNLLELNADLGRFRSLGAEVIAVSGDPPGLTRRRFEEYGALAFPVLYDPGHRVARAYGA